MKMKPEHYSYLKSEITAIAHLVPPAGDKEYRWNLFNSVKFNSNFIKELYEYLNDAQIDTALKKVVKDLEL